MKILMRSQGSKDWKVVDSARYRAETELQDLLSDSPSLIPVDEIREGASPFVVAVREFGLPGSGNTDLLLFNADGEIAIVECKLAANPESRRKVIGQILEYGGYLWRMSYEEVDQRIHKLRGKNLADLVAESVADPEWDEEKFRNGVKDSLTNGTFILIIAVDEINEELSRTIRFLNGCGNPAFSFHALEMRRFEAPGIGILVPHLHGQVSPPPPVWTEEKFFRAIQEAGLSSEVVQVIKDLYQWSRTSADRVWFGTGKETGSFTFHYLKDGRTVSVFSVYTKGNLTLNYGWLAAQVSKDVLEEFHRSIRSIPSFSRVPADFSKWPSIKIAEAFVNQPAALQSFKEAVIALRDKVRM